MKKLSIIFLLFLNSSLLLGSFDSYQGYSFNRKPLQNHLRNDSDRLISHIKMIEQEIQAERLECLRIINEYKAFKEAILNNPFTLTDYSQFSPAELAKESYALQKKLFALEIQKNELLKFVATKQKLSPPTFLDAKLKIEKTVYVLENQYKQRRYLINILAENEQQTISRLPIENIFNSYYKLVNNDIPKAQKMTAHLTDKYCQSKQQLEKLGRSSVIEKFSSRIQHFFTRKPTILSQMAKNEKGNKKLLNSCLEQKQVATKQEIAALALEKRLKELSYPTSYQQLLHGMGSQQLSKEERNALEKTLREQGALEKTSHTLSLKACSLLQDIGYDPTRFETCLGNSLQQQTHTEIVDLLEETATLPSVGKILLSVKESIVNFASLAQELNDKRENVLAITAKKMAVALLDYSKEALNLGLAVGSGVIEGVENTGNALLAVKDILAMPIEQKRHKAAMLMTKCAQLFGGFLREFHAAGTTPEGLEAWQRKCNRGEVQLIQACLRLEEKYIDSSLADKVKKVTAFITENFLLGKALDSILAISKIARLESQALCLLEGEISLDRALCFAQKAESSTALTLSNANIPNIPCIKTFIEHATKRVSESKELAAMNRVINSLKSTIPNHTYDSLIKKNIGSQTFMALISRAEALYNQIRGSASDIPLISQNTGIARGSLEKIKEHLFINEHVLYDGISKFDADIDIACSWQRLVNGDFVQSDLKLLQHEFVELTIMDGRMYPYQICHDITDNFFAEEYNWRSKCKSI